MTASCDRNKKSLDDLNHSNETRNKISREETDNELKTDSNDRKSLIDKLSENFMPNTIITEQDFNQALDDLFGKDEKKKIKLKIDSLWDSNEMLRFIYGEIVKEHLHVQQKTGDIIDFKSKGLDALSTGTLKIIYKEMLDFTAATNRDNKSKWGWGLIEHWKLKLYTPKTIGISIYADKNGSSFKFADEMTKYHERISYRINEFLLTPKSVKSKEIMA